MLDQDYTAKLLNLEDVIITNVENVSEELHIYIELPRKEHICPVCGAATDRVHDYRMQMFPWPEIPSSIFVSAATAVAAASVSSSTTRSCPVITVLPAGWQPRSSAPLKRLCPPKRSAAVSMYPV